MPPVTDRPTEPAPSDATAAGPGRGRAPVKVLLVVAVIGMFAMWGYVVYLAVGPGRTPPADRVADPAFAAAAEQRCAEALAEVAALPPASRTPTPTERADVLEVANRAFARMLDDLEALTPDGDDGRVVRLWLTDWRTYLADRERYAENLRSDPNARLLVTADVRAGGRHITLLIDDFAIDNDIPACGTPLDA